jgi:hypothetical protein
MAVKVIFKAAAQAEIEEAFANYDAARPGLGAEFLDEVTRVEKHLQANPGLGRHCACGRRCYRAAMTTSRK